MSPDLYHRVPHLRFGHPIPSAKSNLRFVYLAVCTADMPREHRMEFARRILTSVMIKCGAERLRWEVYTALSPNDARFASKPHDFHLPKPSELVRSTTTPPAPRVVRRATKLAPVTPTPPSLALSKVPRQSRWNTVLGGTETLDPDVGEPDAPPEEPITPPGPDTVNERLTTAHDRLLIWLSATGKGSVETFARVARTLGLVSEASATSEARQLLRRLVLLGHAEQSSDGRRWCIAPPTLIERIDGSGELLWCGQRTAQQLGLLPTIWTRRVCHQPGNAGPSCWCIQPQGGPLPADFPIHRADAVACELADQLPTSHEWLQSLEPMGGLTNPDRVERWSPRGFVAEIGFQVDDANTCTGPIGMYRLTSERGRHREFHAYLDESGQLRQADWYGLRFLALPGPRQAAIACQRDGQDWLSILHDERWPMLYERALVLCSGLLPHRERVAGNRDRLWYRDVPVDLARVLTEKLGVPLSECP